MFHSRTRRLLGVAIIAALAVAAFGFAAGNTVPSSRAGDGSGTVSGYTVSNIHYTLVSTNPSLIDSVSFSLDAAASDVYVSVDNGTSWTACSTSGGNNFSCDFDPNVSVQPVTSLRVVAAQ
ncbi:MAG: hypothetical protein RMK15_00245 [Chloroflexota bacterium]|nr:hypothetical protein [Dehalococcoidia bacterium]MDW8045700.1 hypothetical protein [Chloroflexota bacterium]